ncbi:ATP-grasp domain-containing protein [Brevibacillus migulae]|uniref:ATP-grasp domain-containing protein n=1 Tax=Brevibacillus migulae TaxID=1644114 RepID=UPI00106E0C04|nr:ATP-grasp domain-containing protein [Brevibacillus migulae]
MNVLLTSVGRRVNLVRCLKESLAGKGKVVAVDCDWTAPALYAADAHQIVSRIDEPDYVDVLLQICIHYQIEAVLSLIDPELSLLARQAESFRDAGVQVIVSSPEVVELCLDKKATSDFLQKHDFPHIPTYGTVEEITDAISEGVLSFPMLVKPRKGSASQGISVVTSITDLKQVLGKGLEELIVQPYLHGDEYGVDAYVDLISGEPVSIFTKRKLRMRAGETDRSLAIQDPALTGLIHRLIDKLQPRGPIDIDCFKIGESYVISEINPRFGGGYPHAYLCGEDYFACLAANLQGRPNVPRLGAYEAGSTMLKYDEVMLVKAIRGQ